MLVDDVHRVCTKCSLEKAHFGHLEACPNVPLMHSFFARSSVLSIQLHDEIWKKCCACFS